MSILTFKYLRELQKSEKDSALLQKIDRGFYDTCAKCLKTDSSEAENIKPLIKNILEMRERKIVTSAIQSARADIKPENLLSEEEELFSKSFDAIKVHHMMIDGMLSGKSHENSYAHSSDFQAILSHSQHSLGSKAEGASERISTPSAIESNNEKAPLTEIPEVYAQTNNGAAGDLIKIRTISDIPSFVAEDMKSYGPFAAGEIAEIPEKAAEVLINSKIAEKKD